MQNIPHMNSLSSSLMFGTTIYRNQQEIKAKMLTQPMYGIIAVVALVEVVAASFFVVASVIVAPVSTEPFYRSRDWIMSCQSACLWAIIYFIFNPFCNVLSTERGDIKVPVLRE